MTQDDDTDDRGREQLVSRRTILATIGALTVGGGIAANRFDIRIGTAGPVARNPPLDESDANPSTGESGTRMPWNTDSLVISVEWFEQDSTGDLLDDFGYEELGNATTFWNDYISASESFDLTLTFERDHDDPDIMLRQANTTNECTPGYKGPGLGNPEWSAAVCVETLRETPTAGDLPVTGTVGQGGRGRGVYRLLAQHAIGRLLGYDIWSDPVSVMNPKITITPSHDARLRAGGHAYGALSRGDRRAELGRHLTDSIANVRTPSMDTGLVLDSARQTLNQHLNNMGREMAEWHGYIDELGLDLYEEAYRETIVHDEHAYLEETITLIAEVLDTYTHEELADGPDELDGIADRLETISNWPDSEPYDVQVHRYVTDALWSEWAAEQTPTETTAE